MQSGTATWLLFLSCCIFSLHNQLEGSGPRRSASQKQQIIWWNFTRFVQSILIQFQILWFMQHLLKKKYLSQDAFLGVSVLPKPGGSPLDHRRKPPAISSGHRHFKRTGFKLLQSWTESFFRTSHVHPSVHLTNYSSPTLFFGVKYDDALSRLYQAATF